MLNELKAGPTFPEKNIHGSNNDAKCPGSGVFPECSLPHEKLPQVWGKKLEKEEYCRHGRQDDGIRRPTVILRWADS